MGWAVFPPIYLTRGQTTVEVMKIMVTSFRRSHAGIAALSASSPAAGHRQPTTLLETPVHSRASVGPSLVGSLLLSPGSWCTQGSVCAFQESVSPVLCKFWQLYGEVNGNLLQEGLCDPKSAVPSHTQGICYPLQGRLLTPVFWPREFHGLYSPWGCKEWGMTV